MRFRSTNLRTKVVALLTSLTALWAFAAWVTVREGVNLLWVQMLDARVTQPMEPLVLELQAERRLSLAYLGDPDAGRREALQATRPRTDALATEFEEAAQSWQADMAANSEVERRIQSMIAELDSLTRVRESIDARRLNRAQAADAYNAVLDSFFRVYHSLGSLDDREIAADTANIISLYRARELLAREDALVTGFLAAGRMSAAEHAQFVQLVGTQRYLTAETVARLHETDRARYERFLDDGAFSRLRSLEDEVMLDGRPGARPPVNGAEWDAAAEPVLAESQKVVLAAGDALLDRAMPVAIGVIVRLALAAGLGLLAVIASIVVSITTARALVRQLERLREAAWRLANERLPDVVMRLGRGDEVDVAKEAPPLDFGDDEIGQVGKAFNAVQETAVRTAVEQAELRRSVRDVFLSLARRTQALVHRQLTLLDAMERRENDAEELEDLFRVDHLATRMRRNAENLIVLSGASPARSWRRNVPMIDVARGAVAEVEDYARVTVLPIGEVALVGRAVGDVIHLLAELVENALSFSPPHTGVQVSGQMVANGYVIEIEDRGLGMSDEELAAANEQIASQPEFRLAGAARLGLFVVSRLTERHGIRVHLKESPYGGTTAVVLIPPHLVTDGDADTATSGAAIPGLPQHVRANQLNGRAVAAIADASLGTDEDGDGPGTRPASTVTVADRPGRMGVAERTGAAGGRGRVLPPDDPDASTTPAAVDRSVASDDAPTLPRRARQRGDGAGRPADPSAGEPRASVAPAQPSTQAREQTAYTPSGLPLRVRQASLAPALRATTPAPGAAPPDAAHGAPDDEPVRAPDEVRKMMSSYQTGTRRGRSDAARLLDEGSDPPPPPSEDRTRRPPPPADT